MSDTVIKIDNISKQYRLGLVGTGTIIHDLNRWWYTVRGKEDPYLKIGETNDRASKASSKYVWALKDITFDIKQGEVLGIIGKNGAGKSTLLKLLSRVTAPTTGSIKAKGRIASLLEVGTGFHPELTGRENIFMNGAIMGMTKHEIRSKLDEIIDFAGVEKYIDTPVKRYSSGMTVRLGFAIAAHLEPEILVVDEVLAVGDAEFQKKAIGKMQDVSRGEGRTVLFVSHNMGAVEKLCNKAIILENGMVSVPKDDVHSVVDLYLKKYESNRYVSTKTKESNSIFLRTSYTCGAKGQQSVFQIDDAMSFRMEFAYKDLEEKEIKIGLALVDKYERKVLISFHDLTLKDKEGEVCLDMKLPYNLIAPGSYSFQLNIFAPSIKSYEFLSTLSPFEIASLRTKYVNLQYEIGLINYDCVWEEY